MNISTALKTFALTIIPALLLIFCQWLANTMTQKDVVLNYKISSITVGNLYTVYIEISNYSEIAIDNVVIASNPPNVINYSYEPSTNSSKPNIWEGEVPPGKNLKVLYILNKEMPITASSLNALLTAKYKARNKETGRLEWIDVNFNEGSAFLSGTVSYLLWYFAPIVISLVLVILVIVIYRRINQAPSKTNP